MSLSGLLLGLVNIGIVVAVLLLIGAVALWICNILTIGVPAQVQKLYLVIVALIALYMIIALLFGIPTVRIVGHASLADSPQLAETPSIIGPER